MHLIVKFSIKVAPLRTHYIQSRYNDTRLMSNNHFIRRRRDWMKQTLMLCSTDDNVNLLSSQCICGSC